MNQFTASLWGDEAWAATLAIKPIWEIIRIVSKDTSPPFYYLLLHAWMEVFGSSEVSIRCLSFIFFLGTCITVFFIGKWLWDKKTGFLAVIITFCNPFLFVYAFEGRMYSLLALTSILSIYFLLKKKSLWFILSTTGALYTHHFSIFIIFLELAWVLKESWGKPINIVLKKLFPFFIIGALYIPWLYPLYYQTMLVKSGFWLGKPAGKDFWETVGKFLIGQNRSTCQIIALGSILLTLILRRWKSDKEKSLFLLCWFFTPLVLTFVISYFFQPIFFDRYMLAAIPAGSLIIVSLRRKCSFLPITLIALLLFLVNLTYFFHPNKRPFKELSIFIKREVSGIFLINHNAAAHHLWESKYYGLQAPIFSPQQLPFYAGTALMVEGDVIDRLPNKKEIGVISSAPVSQVDIAGYHRIKFQQFDQLSFIWMEKN